MAQHHHHLSPLVAHLVNQLLQDLPPPIANAGTIAGRLAPGHIRIGITDDGKLHAPPVKEAIGCKKELPGALLQHIGRHQWIGQFGGALQQHGQAIDDLPVAGHANIHVKDIHGPRHSSPLRPAGQCRTLDGITPIHHQHPAWLGVAQALDDGGHTVHAACLGNPLPIMIPK